jgi:hypothetical protein
MDAFEDIYDERAVVAIEDRKVITVADGLITLLSRKWKKGDN